MVAHWSSGMPWQQDDDDDDDDSSTPTNPFASYATQYPPPPPPPPDDVLALTILYIFSNGDQLVAIEEQTSRICGPATLPTASTTIHREHDPQATSSLDLAKYPAPTTPSPLPSSSRSTSYDASGWPESQTPYQTKPMSSSVSGYGYPSPTSDSSSNQEHKSSPDGDGPSHQFPIGVAVAVPFGALVLLIVGFLYWRRKRQQRRAEAGVTQEMKMRSSDDGLPRYSAGEIPAPPEPLLTGMSRRPTDLAGRSPNSPSNGMLAPPTARAPTGSDTEPPIILNNSIGGAYFTGIDTSDALSMNSGQQNNRMSLDGRSMMSSDDPPPPYRPRSVPPISRETSLRMSNTIPATSSPLAPLSEGNFSTIRLDDGPGLSNPFEDPESSDDEFASRASSPLHSPLVGRRDEGPFSGSNSGYPSSLSSR